ncbi:carbohydrate ABC transporter permease [Caldilinea sp.]|uniref:carbohydrate ABC transporter permease n=1 Tax=Caldilinea sp. TaxID=2293560 RepID=UPI0021DD7DCE|nr:carbohydrate ABC transporter permease [Caldilinea sp.]GIV70154.1 MAG: ABC transporter permease [Caldilinea sp.]
MAHKLQKWLTPKLLVLIGFALTLLYLAPIYWMVVTSIKPEEQIFRTPPSLVPLDVTFARYIEFFGGPTDRPRPPIHGLFYLRNSFILAIGTASLTLLLAIPGAYALARFRLRSNAYFLLMLLISQMIPNVLLVIPLFVLFKTFNIINTYWAVILANTALSLPFSIIILRASLMQIPKDLEEAAMIDGCSRLMALWRVILPLTRAGIVASGVFSFLFAWGDFVFPLTFLQDRSLHPISLVIFSFLDLYQKEWDSLMAFSTALALPVLLSFIFLQRHFIGGMTAGSVK